VGAVK